MGECVNEHLVLRRSPRFVRSSEECGEMESLHNSLCAKDPWKRCEQDKSYCKTRLPLSIYRVFVGYQMANMKDMGIDNVAMFHDIGTE